MPTYDYECTKCTHTFEKFQQMSANRVRKCPVCGGAVRRLIGAGSGVIFKGSGFYETDYKRKKSPGDSAAQSKDTACSSCPAKAEKKCDGKATENSSKKPCD